MKRTAAAATCAAATLLATLLTGCSGSSATHASGASSPGGSSGGYGGATSSAAGAASAGQATVATKSVGKLGTILVDGKGRTLYLFLADKKKNTSTCTGACALVWPPLLTTGTAKAGKGADKKLLGTAKRSGGAKEVTYNGHPLYRYAPDTKPGQTTGQGLDQFGALWYVVNAKGKQVTS